MISKPSKNVKIPVVVAEVVLEAVIMMIITSLYRYHISIN
jgi:hypothetical protein